MPHIVLTEDQLQVIDRSLEPVEVRRTDGTVLARIAPKWTAEEIAEAKRRSAAGPWYSGDQVQQYLQLLEEEIARTGSCDAARAEEIRQKLQPAR
jgi:hypothetical protein